jgi:hypothetical protein
MAQSETNQLELLLQSNGTTRDVFVTGPVSQQSMINGQAASNQCQKGGKRGHVPPVAA